MKEGWRVVAGASSGDLLIFEDREVIGCVESAHPGSVLCIAEVKVGGNIVLCYIISHKIRLDCIRLD